MSVVIIIESTPLGSAKAKEVTEIIMLLSSFNLSPTIIFRGNAIWLIKQDTEHWQMLSMFEPSLFVEQETLLAQGLTLNNLNQKIEITSKAAIQSTISESTFTWVL